MVQAEIESAFDAVAADYDVSFTQTRLGQILRARVWAVLATTFRAGDHLLELACGTGADAVWLGQRGIRVTATDGSAEMVALTRARVERAGLTDQVAVRRCSLQSVSRRPDSLGIEGLLDGVVSNFGGLNTISAWQPLAEALARLTRPGARVVLVPMGTVCPWEIGWHLAHGRPRQALRRFSDDTTAQVGAHRLPISYPTPRQLAAEFAPWFRLRTVTSLGLFLPPSYLGHLVDRWPALFGRLDALEAQLAPYTRGWGDHYIAVFQRADGQLKPEHPVRSTVKGGER